MKTEHKKIAALVGAGLIAGAALGGAVGVVSQQSNIDNLSADIAALEALEPTVVVETVTVEVPVETIVEVPVVEYVNQTVEVPVDSGNLGVVLDAIYENNGDVEFLIDDLDDDEVDQIVERVIFVNEAKALAVAEVKAELFGELDGEMVNSTELDERDMSRLRIDDDADELLLSGVDFENSDANVLVTGSFEQEDVKYVFSATVKIKDGEVDDLKNIEVLEE